MYGDPRMYGGGQVVPAPGPSQYPPQFSYGLPQGYGQFSGPASHLGGLVGQLPSAISGISAAAGIGSIFAPKSMTLMGLSMLDPTSAAIQAGISVYGRGAGLGASGMAAGVAGLGVAAGLEGMRWSSQQVMTGMAEHRQLGGQLGAFSFANPAASMGRGFSASQTRQIGSMMRELDAADPFTQMRDLNQSMDQFIGMGMGRGVEDAREFGRKFRQFASNLRDMARELGTTMEEAGKVFGQMRQAGFYSSADVRGNTSRMMMAGGLGMDQGTYLNMQQGGANITRAANLTGRAGALTAGRFGTALMVGARQGHFSDETLMDITGAATGSDAAAAMGNHLTGLMTGFLHTGAGRGFLAAMGSQDGGRFNGGLDGSQLSRFLSGQVKLSGLSGEGRSRMTTSSQRGSFAAQEGRIASSLLESEGGVQAVMQAIQDEARQHFKGSLGDDDSLVLFIKQVIGADERTAEVVKDLFKNYRRNRQEQMSRMRQELVSASMQSELKRKYTIGGIMTGAAGSIDDFGSSLKQSGADMYAAMQQHSQGTMDYLLGINRSQTTQTTFNASLDRLGAGEGSFDRFRGLTRPSDFTMGTAGHAMAVQGGMYHGEEGVRAALDFKQKLAAGGDVSVQDLTAMNYGSKQQLDAFMGSPEGSKVTRLLRDASAAEALGNTSKAEEMRRLARNKVEKHMLQDTSEVINGQTFRRSQGGRRHLQGQVDQYMAYVALQNGDTRTANRFAGRGSTSQAASFDEVVRTKDAARSDLESLGINSGVAEQLASGGAGAELFIKLTQSDEFRDKALTYFRDMKGVAGDDFTAMAERASEELGGNFSEADVKAYIEATHDVEYGRESSLLRMATPLGTYDIATAAARRLDPSGTKSRFLSAGSRLTTAIDTKTYNSDLKSIRSSLLAANPELRKHLGSEKYSEFLDSLAAGKPSEAAALAILRNAKGAGHIEGGEEYERIGGMLAQGEKYAASGDAAGLEQMYGLKAGSLAGKDLATEARHRAYQEFMGSSAAGTAGISLRGMSTEQQVYLTAKAVKDMTEAVTKLTNHVNAVTEDGGEAEAPSGGSWWNPFSR